MRPVFGVGFPYGQGNCALFGGWADYFEVPNCLHMPPVICDCEYITPFMHSRQMRTPIEDMSALPPKADMCSALANVR